MSMEIVVAAALLIIVLIVMAVWFTNKTSQEAKRIEEISALDIRQFCLQQSSEFTEYNKCVEDCKKAPANCKLPPTPPK